MAVSRTVIISCAGMGNRLGLGTTKALVEIEGKPLIVRHLETLQEEKDIRIVVGFQAEKVIEAVQRVRDDILFVFNHQYRETGTGDLLVHPEDMKRILACDHEFVSGGVPMTDDPWMLQTYGENGKIYVNAFSKNAGNYEWNGITQMKSEKMLNGSGHVFQLIEPYLPIPFLELRTREIDTVSDYERAVEWVKNGFT